MLKQGLNIKLGQSLSMTPQLQQAIRLLQLSSVELHQEIQEMLETNPLLERVDDNLSIEVNDKNNAEQDNTSTTNSSTDSIPEELSIDADWDDIYDPAWKVSNNSDASSASDFIETMHSSPQGLHEHLSWQISLSNLSAIDKEIATMIIDYIDEDGFLTEPLVQIHSTLEEKLLIELDEVEAVLTYIQHLGPIGIGARDLGECLLLQLNEFHISHNYYKKAKLLLEDHLETLVKRDYTGIRKALRLTPIKFELVMELIRSLEPAPGKGLCTTTTDYITPDIYIKRIKDKWKISFNGDTFPDLQINDYYAGMLKTSDKSKITKNSVAINETENYIKDNLQQAKWFMKSLENRNSTIVNVAQAIIERQLAFFQYGDEAMKPMILKDLADQLGLHESTISRVTTRKYMHTPRGVYEFKYFFSSHVSTDTGGECSATAIRAMIKKIIAKENPNKPLSDNKLTSLLKEQGINVARRTVAKYRESLAIASSHDRKVFA